MQTVLRPLPSAGILTRVSRAICERRVWTHRCLLTREQTSPDRSPSLPPQVVPPPNAPHSPTLCRESPASAVGLERGTEERRSDVPPTPRLNRWYWVLSVPGGERGWSGPGGVSPSWGSGAKLSGRTSLRDGWGSGKIEGKKAKIAN